MTLQQLIRGGGSHRAQDRIEYLEAELRKRDERLAFADQLTGGLQAKNEELYVLWQFAERKAANAEDIVVTQAAVIEQLRERNSTLWAQIKKVPPVVAPPTAPTAPPANRFDKGPVVVRLGKAKLRVPKWAPADSEETQEIPLADRLVQGVAS